MRAAHSRPAVVLLVATLAATAAAASATPPEPDLASPPDAATIGQFRRLVADGVAQLVRRDPERAAALFRQVEALVPSSAEGPYLLAGALAQAGRPEEATSALARAVLSGFEDHERMEFDRALVPLREDPRFRLAAAMAMEHADRLLEGRAVGPSPEDGRTFATLEDLRAHHDRLERDSGRWRAVQTPGEHQRLRWRLIDARRAALDRFALRNGGKREALEAEIEGIALLEEYRDPVHAAELELGQRLIGGFLDRNAGSDLAPRARWLALHLRRRTLSPAMPPGDREAAGQAVAADLAAFAAEAKEKGWPEGGLALLDLAAVERDRPGGDPAAVVARMKTEYAGVDLVWTAAREKEAALLLRIVGVPDFAAKDLAGRERGREHLLGQVVLIDFWATWCRPCLDQAPDLARLHRELGGGGRFLLLGVSIDAADEIGDEAFAAFLVEHGIVWPQVRDGLGEDSPVARAFGLETVPFQVLVAPDGSVVEAGPEVAEETIRAALAPAEGP